MAERLPDQQRDQLALLLDALECVVTDDERRSLEWLAGWDKPTVERIANAITRAVWSAGQRGQAAAHKEIARRRKR